MQGQLYKADRELLYNTVIETKPKWVYEVGTGYGGGSTLSIAKALHKCQKGTLITIEMMQNFYYSATSSYEKECPELLPYVEFNLGKCDVIYPKKLESIGGRHVDIVFLDGCGTKSKGGHLETLNEVKMFEPYMKKGGFLMMHDWRDAKAELAKPYLQNSPKWKIIKELGPPESVGFGKIKYVG
jgi:cephalosporin hydroxylase